jgi:NAD(P)-dependent dehydrogenase (short-subunit alcohol dehydrogenase family)
MSQELAGQVAVVTGGASGIGRAIAADLAAAGAHVVVADVSGAAETAAALTATLTGSGSGSALAAVGGVGTVTRAEVMGLALDVASEEQTTGLAAAVLERFGRIDVLVNNAGLFTGLRPGPLTGITVAEWRRVMDVNVLGTFLCTRAVVDAMADGGGGRIVNIASTTAFKGVPNLLHYVASKGAVIALTRAAAVELGPRGILVNAVAPGFTVSDGVLGNEAAMDPMRSTAAGKRPLGREQTPADVVGAVRFLCGPSSGFVTGQTLVVDGGAYLH